MPAYNTSPFTQTPSLLLPGQAGYSFGSFNDHLPTVKIFALTSAVNGSNVATVTGKIWEGNVPTTAAGFKTVSTQGLANIANVTNVTITSISYNTSTGVITLVYPCTNATFVAAADTGLILIPQSEVPELLSAYTAPAAGSAFALGSFAGLNTNGRTIAWKSEFPSAPASVTLYLEAALQNVDAQYLVLDTSTNTAGDLRYVDVTKFNFVRVKVYAYSGGSSPSIIAAILV